MDTLTFSTIDNKMGLKTPFTITDEILWEKINNWDFSRICLLAKYQFNHSSEKIESMLLEYKKYMFLVNKYSELKIPMSNLVDDIWHVHIISTHNYIEFCNYVSGKYTHHVPVINESEVKKLSTNYLNNTLPLMKKHFYINNKFWPEDASFACCETLAEEYGNR